MLTFSASAISYQIRHQGQKAAANPTVASSPEHKANVDSRATDEPGVGSTGGSTAKPVDSHDYTGNSEEGQDPAKSDPNESTEQKRKNVLEQGNKPLDAADK